MEVLLTLFGIVNEKTITNLKIYKNEPEWLKNIPRKKSRVRANRIFVNQETVINSLISNPPNLTF
jgi:hypothetical protein